MNLTYRKGNYRKLQFNALNKTTEMIITNGILVLDKATLSNCKHNDIVIHLSYQEENNIKTVTKPLSQFTTTPTRTGYHVDFMKNVTVSCWLNITEPTRLKIDITGMSGGKVDLDVFVIRI